MSDTIDRLQKELAATQRALAESEERRIHQEAETCRQIEEAHKEWLAALDVVGDPIFMYDKNFRILRCNRAYQKLAGLPFNQIIGHLYFDIFPKNHSPLQTMEQSDTTEAEQEIQVGETLFRSRLYSLKDEKGQYLHSVHLLEDITEQMKTKRILHDSEKKFLSITSSAQDAILIMDDEGQISYWNKAAERMFGYSSQEALGQSLHGLLTPERFLAAHHIGFSHFQKTGEGPAVGKTLELAALKKDGTEFPIELSLSAVRIEGRLNAIGIIRDITERKESEKNLQNEKVFSETLFQSLPDIFFLLDTKGNLLQWNKKFEELSGLSREKMQECSAFTFVHEEDIPLMTQKIQQVLETGSASAEAHLKFTNGLRNYLITGNRVETQFGINIIGIGIDITERKEAEISLKQERDFSDHLVETAPVIILILNMKGKIIRFNQYMESLAGYSLNEVEGKDWFDIFLPEAIKDKTRDIFLQATNDIQTNGYINAIKTKDGHEKLIEWYSKTLKDIDNHTIGLLSIGMDVTTREESEESLYRANRALKTLSAGNMALVRAKNESELLQTITDIIVKQAGYNFAAVVYAEKNPEKSIRPVASTGMEMDNHNWPNEITWDDTPNGQLPISEAIRTGATQICRNIACTIGPKLWKDSALSQGYVSNIALPLSNASRTFGALCIYSSDTNAFDEQEIRLLEEMANDLAYGIITLRTRIEHEQHSIILRQSLEQSIQIIAATVEARDPYTAGHQRRVSELATAIAQEIELNEEDIQGIHFASIIHDLGKIHIPAEILSKPGKLSEIEFMLIKTHPQAGYDILKDVKFPWPIADIILQHHEKMDGSGYPQGLKDEEIRIEAKIICVADVVEAMSSHRPYRASLGIKPALDEIRHGRGRWYDATIVDACLKLFEEKRFSFSSDRL